MINPTPGCAIDNKVDVDTQFDFQNSDLDTSFKLSNTLQNKLDNLLEKARPRVAICNLLGKRL